MEQRYRGFAIKGFVKHKYFAKVILARSSGFITTVLSYSAFGVAQAHGKQASRCNPVSNDASLAFVEISYSASKKYFGLHEQGAVWVKYKYPSVRLVRYY